MIKLNKSVINLFILFGCFQIISCQIIFPKDDDEPNSFKPNPSNDTEVRVDSINSACRSPNGRSGNCVPIRSCNNLWKLVEKQANFQLTYPELVFLRNSQCGEVNGQIYVCCDPREVSKQPVAPPPRPQANKKPINSNLLPSTSQCASIGERIYGGQETDLGEFPWMALIEYTKKSDPPGHHCGGSLINNRYVLTAAHCIQKIPKEWRQSAVRLGEHDTTTNPDCELDLNNNESCAPPHVDVPIEKTIVHEDYNPTSKHQYHDIALLRLARPVQYSDYIQPICLPISNQLQNKDLTGIGLAVAGWGRTETGYSSTKKLKAIVKGVSLSSCNSVYSQQRVSLQDTQMCAGGEKGVDSCNGDSGGPLIGMETTTRPNHFYLAALVSFGPRSCGTQGWPGVYTKIAPHIDWIVKNLEP